MIGIICSILTVLLRAGAAQAQETPALTAKP